MFRYGFPLFVSTVLTGFLAQFYNFMMAIYCTDSMIGNYKASVNFIVLISLFREPIATVLFPAFSKLNAKKDKKTLRTIFQYSVKYASFLTAPVTVAIMVLSGPLVVTLFGAEYTYAPLFLALNAIIYLYSALGNLSLGSFLNGQGRTMVTMRLTMIRLAIGFLLSLLLIPSFGIIGLITTLLISGLPSLTIGLWWTRKHFGITVEWGSSARILASSATAAVTTQLVLSRLQTLEWESLIIGGLIFFVTYLVVTPLLRAINIDDVRNLKQMLSEFGPLSHLLNFLLNLIERLAMIFQKTQDKT